MSLLVQRSEKTLETIKILKLIINKDATFTYIENAFKLSTGSLGVHLDRSSNLDIIPEYDGGDLNLNFYGDDCNRPIHIYLINYNKNIILDEFPDSDIEDFKFYDGKIFNNYLSENEISEVLLDDMDTLRGSNYKLFRVLHKNDTWGDCLEDHIEKNGYAESIIVKM